jgi:hypothetical protein
MAELERADRILGAAGVRLLELEDGPAIGVWRDLDGREVRSALAAYGWSDVPVRYLDGNVPIEYKVRRVPGEPTSLAVLMAMKQAASEPWIVRDRLLGEMGRSRKGSPRP